MSGPLIVAHRGAWGPAPQNSLQAFSRAIDLGCDMVELDVRRTRDGRLVVVHDARVRGTPVAELDYEALQERLPAPLLEDVLELITGRIAADVELKQDGYAEQAVAMLRDRLAPASFVVTSFIENALRAAGPEIATGLLLRPGRVSTADARLAHARATFVAPHISLVRTGILAWVAERGMRSYVWTVNDARRLQALFADGRVEAVITDRPARALDIRALRAH